jgi:hypothetical protein
VNAVTKVLEPSSNVHSGPPDQKSRATHLYDVCMSTSVEVEASIWQLDCMSDLYRDLWKFVKELPKKPPAGTDADFWSGMRCFGNCRRAAFNRVCEVQG